MDSLSFSPVGTDNLKSIYKFTSKYGEGSCQHSGVSMYSLYDKYGDKFCIEDDHLFILRENLCDDEYRVYMAPFGPGDQKKGYERIISDAHSYGRKVRFHTLTKSQAMFLVEAFPEQFDIRSERDLFEYIYNVTTMLEFPGKVHQRRRTEIRSFWRDYGDRTTVSAMTENDLAEVEEFAKKWLIGNNEADYEVALDIESRSIHKQLKHFLELNLSGTIIRIDGKIEAFCYGTPLNDKYYDVLIEKGSREYPGLYRVLRQESTKLNLGGFSYINFEEDVGVPGLRKVKESYGPEFMIEKYKVREK